MKTLIKFSTTFVLAAIFFIGSQNAVQAQSPSPVDVSATAEVLATLEANVTGIDFGFVTQSSSATVNPDGSSNANAGAAGSTVTAGAVDISGTASAAIDVTCEGGATLSDGTNTITMTTAAEIGGSPLTCDGTTTNASSLDGTGALTVDIGGTIGDTGTNPGVFNTSNAGGDAVTVTFVYQ